MEKNDSSEEIPILSDILLRTETPSPSLSEIEIAWANMRVSDQHLHLSTFVSAALGWLKANDGEKNYQDLEKELRKRDFSTHIFASSKRETGFDILLPFSKNEQKPNFYIYEAFFSCRPPPFAMKELLTHSTSYQENFDKLKYSGTLITNEVLHQMDVISDIHMFDEDETAILAKITYNKVLISLEKTPIFFKDFQNRLKEKYPNLAHKVIGLYDGGPLFVFVSDSEIVSPIGFYFKVGNDGEIFPQLKDLTISEK